MTTVLVTGANRGIGLEFVHQLTSRGDTIFATARAGSDTTALRATGATIIPLEVSDSESVEKLAAAVRGLHIDVLINNAGVSSTSNSLAACTQEELQRVLTINSIGPVLVARSVVPAMKWGGRKLIVNITSVLGSIGGNAGGSSYGYRASKAALNMFTVCMAHELRTEGFTCVAMHPGWVQTDMGGKKAPLTPPKAVESMIGVIDRLTAADSGRYLNYDGATIEW